MGGACTRREIVEAATAEHAIEASERYGGLRLEPQIGLVLLPGTTCWLGAQREDQGLPNYDVHAWPDETPWRVSLEPFFLSKYEMTQGQWQRITGTNPSFHQEPDDPATGEDTSQQPVGTSGRTIGWTSATTSVSDRCARSSSRAAHRLSGSAPLSRPRRTSTVVSPRRTVPTLARSQENARKNSRRVPWMSNRSRESCVTTDPV